MRVSCVVLNYNDSQTTISMVDRIIGYDSIDKIIIVDNNSSDDSYLRISSRYEQNEKVLIIKAEKNGGYGYGNNLGIRASRQLGVEYVLIANPDVVFDNQCVINLRMELENHKDVAVTSAIQLSKHKDIIKCFAWNLIPKWEYILSFSRLFWSINLKYSLSFNSISNYDRYKTDCVPGAMLMLRSDVFPNGAYDERIFLYCEETVLGLKMKELGFSTTIIPGKYYIHNHSVSINKVYGSKGKQRSLMRNSGLKVLKYYYKSGFISLLFARLFFMYCFIETSIIDIIDYFIR